MADITTSIAITADASKAIAEMQRVTTTVDNLAAEQVVITPQVNAQGIADFKQTISGAISIPVTTTMADGGMTQQIIDAKNQIQNSQSIINGLLVQQEATTGRIAAAEANVVASKAAQVSATSQATSLIKNQETSAQNTNVILDNQVQKRKDILDLLTKMKSMKLVQIAKEVESLKNKDKEKEKTEEEAEEERKRRKAEAEEKQRIAEWDQKALENAKKIRDSNLATNGHLERMRNNIRGAAEAYESFSSGRTESGMANLKSISLNILSDIYLAKQVAQGAYELGGKIYEFATTYQSKLRDASSTVQRTLSQSDKIRMNFTKMTIDASSLPDYIKSVSDNIDKLNKKILEPSFFSKPIDWNKTGAQNWKEMAEARAKEVEANKLIKKDYEILLEKAKELLKQEKQRAVEKTGLSLLNEEAQIKEKTAMDIADLEAQLFMENDEFEKKLLQKRIDIRKKLGEKELSDFKKNEDEKKKQADERLAEEDKKKQEQEKRELDRIKKLLEDARNAEAQNLDEVNKIKEKYFIDSAKFTDQYNEAKTQAEKDIIKRLHDARKKARDIELDEYQKKQKKIADDAAKDAKDKLIESANLQKSQLEDIANYQRQLVNQFSGLQGSVFPKEALQLLRTIANNGSIR